MSNRHAESYVQLLKGVANYSGKTLSIMEAGAGDFPQWTNDVISESKTHMSDVTHFLRGQSSKGIRYGSGHHGAAYMARANLRHIENYANEALGYVSSGGGHYPAWVENKISVVAEYMDRVFHWLENEGAEGRRYGLGSRGRALRRKARKYSGMEWTPPPSRMNERNRMITGGQSRMLWDQTGRQLFDDGGNGRGYGVPGVPFPRPGWAGNAGVAQVSRPGACAKSPIAGAVQTYGSLGYGSMGDGSMDMAVRGGGRRFGSGKSKRSFRRRRRGRA